MARPALPYHLAGVPGVLRGAVLHQAVLVQVLAAAVRAGEGVAVRHWTAEAQGAVRRSFSCNTARVTPSTVDAIGGRDDALAPLGNDG